MKVCSQRVGDLLLQESVPMVPAGNKAQRFSLVNSSANTMYQSWMLLISGKQIVAFNFACITIQVNLNFSLS